jgi:signal-transduction protein with cAMP-binding, CBS, and nucleotidyltransferase domain
VVILVKDIMVKPLTIDANKNAKSAGELMRKTRRDSLIVVKNKRPIGIVTDSDLIKKIIAKNKKPSSIKVRAIMSRPLVTSKPSDTILEATRKMKRNNIKRLPVLDKGKIVGSLSLSDIARSSPEMIDLLEYKLKMRELPTEIKERFTSGICDSCGNYSDDLRNISDKWLCESCREEAEE